MASTLFWCFSAVSADSARSALLWSDLETEDICPVSAADICPVSTEDIYPVSTEDITAAGRRPAAVPSSVETG